jgi:hypothetical protein
VHDYLGMNARLQYEKGMLRDFGWMIMSKSVLEEAPADMDGEVEAPAAEHLFTGEIQRDKKHRRRSVSLFHILTARLLFLSNRARPAIQTAVTFSMHKDTGNRHRRL